MRNLFAVLLLGSSFMGVDVLAAPIACDTELREKLNSLYTAFLQAAKADDLSAVKRFSTIEDATAIAQAEKSGNDKSTIGRMMYAFSPRLEGARDIRCEQSKNRARLIITHEVRGETNGKPHVPRDGFGVVMFEQQGKEWKVGKKASTQPMANAPLSDLLKHEALQLP
jgi:hypothetical protein